MKELEALDAELSELRRLLDVESEPDEFSPEWFTRQSLLRRQADLLHRSSMLRGEFDIEVSLDGESVHRHAVEAGFVGGLLERLQTTLTAIVHENMGETATRGSFRGNVIDVSKLELVATRPGSFILGLASHHDWYQSTFWAEDEAQDSEDLTPLDEALDRLMNLIESGQLEDVESEELRNAVAGLGGHRAVARAVELSNFVGQSGTSARIVHRRRFDESIKEANLTVPVAMRLRDTLRTVETRERTVERSGILSGVRWTARSFELELEEQEGTISGNVPLNLRHVVRELFDRYVDAVLIERTTRLLDGAETTSYTLIDLKASESTSGSSLPGLGK